MSQSNESGFMLANHWKKHGHQTITHQTQVQIFTWIPFLLYLSCQFLLGYQLCIKKMLLYAQTIQLHLFSPISQITHLSPAALQFVQNTTLILRWRIEETLRRATEEGSIKRLYIYIDSPNVIKDYVYKQNVLPNLNISNRTLQIKVFILSEINSSNNTCLLFQKHVMEIRGLSITLL